METDQRIAETTIIVVPSNGPSFNAKLALGIPTYEKGVAFCTVYFDGIQRPMPIAGEDTLHALCLALQFMRKLLEMWRDDMGWKFFDNEVDFDQPDYEDYRLDVDVLFGTHRGDYKA